jgi:hypothetical protein
LIGLREATGRRNSRSRCVKRVCLNASAFAVACAFASSAFAVDITFNISYIAEADPVSPGDPSTFHWGDVWAENGFAYVGSDRNGGGMSIFSISNAGIPLFEHEYEGVLDGDFGNDPTGTVGFEGEQMEDVEVYDGLGFFSSDVSTSSGTGVDIVDLAIPTDPIRLSRVNGSLCSAAGCGHNKVHTLSVSEGYLYTADNATDTIKIVDVRVPEIPVVVKSLELFTDPTDPTGIASHEVVVRNDRLYIASKRNSTPTANGYFHIYDVSDPENPVRLKEFLSGGSSHTAMPSIDGNTLVIAEERLNGNVLIYDISAIDDPDDPDPLPPPKILNRSNVCHNGNCLDAHTPHHVHMHGNLMFITWYEAGLTVFNIANPANPVFVGAFDTFPGGPPDGSDACSGSTGNCSGAWGVDLSLGLDRVLISDRQRGLIVVNATGLLKPGDYNQDTFVNGNDYPTWSQSFGDSRSFQHDAPFADGNFNGIVDAADYVIWRKFIGFAGPGGGAFSAESSVPEPASMLLLSFAACVFASRRARFNRA